MPRYIIGEILYLECFQTMIRHLWQTVPSWERKKAEGVFMGNKNVAKTSDTGVGEQLGIVPDAVSLVVLLRRGFLCTRHQRNALLCVINKLFQTSHTLVKVMPLFSALRILLSNIVVISISSVIIFI